MTHNKVFILAPLLLGLAVTAGCGRKDDAKTATQVAAKVNGDELTVHQVNYLLARSRGVTPETAPQVKYQVLEQLINQQIAMQQAIEKKLDRAPGVVQAIELARKSILARAYLEQIAAASPKPSADEVNKFYAEHPELFAQRRIFNLEEIVVQPSDELEPGLREQVGKARSMQDIASWLNSRGTKFSANRVVRAAEQIPLELLPKIQAMKDGEMQVIPMSDSLNVLRVVATKSAPVDEKTAMPRIEKFLFNQSSQQNVAAVMKRLREKADIAYLGEFASKATSASESKPAASRDLPAAWKAGAPEGAQAPSVDLPAAAPEPPPSEPEPAASNFEKGVRGLR